MAIDISPFEVGHPEFVPEAEITAATRLNEHLLRGRTQERARSLRASVVQKLGEIGALGPKGGWAIYDLSEEEDGSVATLGATSARQTLLLAFESPFRSKLYPRPLSIRIIADRIFSSLDDTTALAAEQVLLDQDDDLFHGYHGGVCEAGTTSLQTIYFPFFGVETDGQLHDNESVLGGYPPPLLVATEAVSCHTVQGNFYVAGGKKVLLGGLYTDPFDAAFAVDRGQELFDAALGGSLHAHNSLDRALQVRSE